MNIDLTGEELTGSDVEYTVVLRTSGGYTITIESTVTVESSAGTYQADPSPESAEDLATYLDLVMHRRISSSVTDENGGLVVSFDSGTRILVAPDDDFEAWTITGPNGQMAVSGPGGELTEWSGHDAP